MKKWVEGREVSALCVPVGMENCVEQDSKMGRAGYVSAYGRPLQQMRK